MKNKKMKMGEGEGEREEEKDVKDSFSADVYKDVVAYVANDSFVAQSPPNRDGNASPLLSLSLSLSLSSFMYFVVSSKWNKH